MLVLVNTIYWEHCFLLEYAMPKPMTLIVMSNRETNYSPQTLLFSGGGIEMGKTDSLSSLQQIRGGYD